jgi:hypothetical protein
MLELTSQSENNGKKLINIASNIHDRTNIIN